MNDDEYKFGIFLFGTIVSGQFITCQKFQVGIIFSRNNNLLE